MGAPVSFAEATKTLTAPKGLEDQVAALPVAEGGGRLVSCWELSDDELVEIVRTGRVWLSVLAHVTQPPVFVTGHKHQVLEPEPQPELAPET